MLLGGFLPLLSCSSAPPAADWAVPNSLPTNSSHTRVFIVGHGFDVGRASPASCTLISGSWDLDAEASVPVAATVHNATHASCVPPRAHAARRDGPPHTDAHERHGWKGRCPTRVLSAAVSHGSTETVHIGTRRRGPRARPLERACAHRRHRASSRHRSHTHAAAANACESS